MWSLPPTTRSSQIFPSGPPIRCEPTWGPCSQLCRPNDFFTRGRLSSSEVNESSEADQTAFIREIFAAWDAYADQIQLISFTWLNDLPRASVQELEAYYGLKNPGFAEFLRTLGLRKYAGASTDKPAWSALAAEAEVRGW